MSITNWRWRGGSIVVELLGYRGTKPHLKLWIGEYAPCGDA